MVKTVPAGCTANSSAFQAKFIIGLTHKRVPGLDVLHEMTSYLIWIYLLMIVLIAQQQQQSRKRRQMGPRLKVDQATFLAEVSKRQAKVIRGPKVLWQGYAYLIRGEDYYYYTVSKETLHIPEGIEVTNVAQILL